MDASLDEIAYELLGYDAATFGKDLFSGVHVGGRIVAGLFGGAGLADAAEQLESPILQPWARRGQAADIRIFDNAGLAAITAKKAAKAGAGGKDAAALANVDLSKITSTSAPPAASEPKDPDIVITKPAYIALFHNAASANDAPSWVSGILAVGVWGGKRFEGSKPPYNPRSKSEPGKSFSFGYDKPARVDVLMPGEGDKYKTISMRDIRQIAFAGGAETVPGLAGDGTAPPGVVGIDEHPPGAVFKVWGAVVLAVVGALLLARKK